MQQFYTSDLPRGRWKYPLFLLALLFFGSTFAYAQNVVVNPGFETNTGCPSDQDQLGLCVGWTKATDGTSDYYNACCTLSCKADVPNNAVGSQAARNGDAYAGFIASQMSGINGITTYREYLKGEFSLPGGGTTLVAGKRYKVEFYVSLAELSCIAVKNIGAYIGGNINQTGYTSLKVGGFTVTPQITEPAAIGSNINGINARTNWYKVSGTYTANGTETNIYIGYFNDNLSSGTHYDNEDTLKSTVCGTTTYESSEPYAYYYVDDVSVSECGCGDTFFEHEFVRKSQAPNGQCCFDLKLKALTGACEAYGAKVRFPGATQSYIQSSANGTWTLSSPAGSQTPTWTSSTPLPTGTQVTLGSFCISNMPSGTTIVIDLLDKNGQTMCMIVSSIGCESCCDSLQPQFMGFSSIYPDLGCCFSFSTNVPAGCDIASATLSSLTPGTTLVPHAAPNPIGITPGSITFNKSGNTISGNFCLEDAGNGGSKSVKIDYYDALGNLVCSKTVTLQCPPCGCGGSSHDAIFTLKPDRPDSLCCWTVDIQAFANACQVYGVEVLLNGVVVFQNTNLSGGPIGPGETRRIGEFCLPKFTSTLGKTVQIRYLKQDGTVLCTDSEVIHCQCNCPGSAGLESRVERAIIPTGSDACCWDLYVKNPNKCDILAKDGIFVSYGPYQPVGQGTNLIDPPIIGIAGGQWTGSLLPGFDVGNDNTAIFTNPTGTNIIPAGKEIFMGRICVQPSSPPLELSVNIATLFPGGGAGLCPINKHPLDCPKECCDNIKIWLEWPDISTPDAPCCATIHANKLGEACPIYGIRIIGGSGGVAQQPTPVNLTPFKSPNPIGHFCVSRGTSRTIYVEFLDANGHVICSKNITIDCKSSGGGNPPDSPTRQGEIGSQDNVSTLACVPNPAHGEVSINYMLSETGTVRIEVYNSAGEMVDTIDRGQQEKGPHSFDYSMRALSQGSYIIKLSINGTVLSTQVNLIR